MPTTAITTNHHTEGLEATLSSSSLFKSFGSMPKYAKLQHRRLRLDLLSEGGKQILDSLSGPIAHYRGYGEQSLNPHLIEALLSGSPYGYVRFEPPKKIGMMDEQGSEEKHNEIRDLTYAITKNYPSERHEKESVFGSRKRKSGRMDVRFDTETNIHYFEIKSTPHFLKAVGGSIHQMDSAQREFGRDLIFIVVSPGGIAAFDNRAMTPIRAAYRAITQYAKSLYIDIYNRNNHPVA